MRRSYGTREDNSEPVDPYGPGAFSRKAEFFCHNLYSRDAALGLFPIARELVLSCFARGARMVRIRDVPDGPSKTGTHMDSPDKLLQTEDPNSGELISRMKRGTRILWADLPRCGAQ